MLRGGLCPPALISRFLALCASQAQSLLNVSRRQQLHVSLSFPPVPSHPDFGALGLRLTIGQPYSMAETFADFSASSRDWPWDLGLVTESRTCGCFTWVRHVDEARGCFTSLLPPLRALHSGLCRFCSSLMLSRDVCCVAFVSFLLFFLAGSCIGS